MTVHILVGDTRGRLKELADESVIAKGAGMLAKIEVTV